MRVPDSLLQNKFMVNLNRNRSTIADIQNQLATQSKVNKPSDNPLSNSRIMRMQNQLNNINTYKSNVTYAQSIIDDSILSMESMQNEILSVQQQLTQVNSAIVGDDLSSFAQAIDASIEILIDLANSEYNGQYNFGGTENNSRPFNYDKNNNVVTANFEHIGGDRVVKISPSIVQKINISGQELFQSVFKQGGNLDSTASVGSVQSNSGKIYDSDGNEYSLNINYTKTEANTYEMNYTITDSDSNVIENQTVSDLKFNSETGDFESIDGDKFGEIHVQNSTNKIDFIINLNSLNENNTTTNIVSNLSQKSDIFNTLIGIREKLLNGERPTSEQTEIVNAFNKHLLNNISKAGGISVKLSSAQEILGNQELEVSSLLSLEKDVDVAQALIDLESAQYTLDISYKISSMILPKSLLDYM